MPRDTELFHIALEAAPTAMIAMDDAGKVVLANREAELLFGYTKEELEGSPIELLVPERFHAGHRHSRSRFLRQPLRRPMGAGRDLYGRRKDGSEVAVEIGLNPFRSEGKAFVLASVIDVTERKRAEERVRSALGDKDVLLKEVHHRVKNNLQVISSLLSLQATAEGGEVAELLRQSQHRIQAMAMIHEMLYRSGSLARIDMGAYVRSLVEMLRNSYEGLAARLDVDVPVPQVFVPMDAAVPVGLVVNELASNAMKHAFEGGGEEGTISIALDAPPEGGLRIRVVDDGKGLPPAGGVDDWQGLGLRLVRILASQLGAELEIGAGTGGASFVLHIPPEALHG